MIDYTQLDYTQTLLDRFKDLKIDLVRHDCSPTGLPAYIEVQLPKMPSKANRVPLVLDLGNYLYRVFGLRFQMTPEFRGKGKTTTVRWFMSWEDLEPIKANIFAAQTLPRTAPLKADHFLPFEFTRLIIQNTARGVAPCRQ